MTVVSKCITITEDQDNKIRAIQLRRMTAEKKSVSYSSVLQQAIEEGLNLIK